MQVEWAGEQQTSQPHVEENGMKMRNTNAGHNGSGSTYIYIAFAEQPFKYANAE